MNNVGNINCEAANYNMNAQELGRKRQARQRHAPPQAPPPEASPRIIFFRWGAIGEAEARIPAPDTAPDTSPAIGGPPM